MFESFINVFSASFVIILLAEFGDKSQLVCMSLASRFSHRAIVTAAFAAFAVLNALAVTFGSLVSAWVPDHWLAAVVAVMFLVFGLQALRTEEDDDEDAPEVSAKRIFFSTFALIFVAEFGDKTQLAVAGLGTQYQALFVWIGSTLALFVTTLAGVYLGKKLLTRMPVHWIHRFSGVLFLIFSALAGWDAYQGLISQS